MKISLRSVTCALAALLLGACASPDMPPIRTDIQALSQDSRVQFIVIHATQENFADSLRILSQGGVSSHYLVDVTPPTIYRLVDEDRRAWHAGASQWQSFGNLNAASVGIEVVNPAPVKSEQGWIWNTPYPQAQLDAVIALVKSIAKRHGVRADRILAHSDIAPQRKVDPGPHFPWKQLAQAGLIPWPDAALVARQQRVYESALPDVQWFQDQLAAHGFSVPRNGQLDEPTRVVIAAFQMKYRPARYDGAPDAETAALLSAATTPGGMLMSDGTPFKP